MSKTTLSTSADSGAVHVPMMAVGRGEEVEKVARMPGTEHRFVSSWVDMLEASWPADASKSDSLATGKVTWAGGSDEESKPH